MTTEIRHKRLHAFFESKVLNVLIIAIVVCLLIVAYTDTLLLPVTCGTIAMAFFIGYSLWLWIKKPASIVTNPLLSNITSLYVLYSLIISVARPASEWFYTIPVALSVAVLFLALTNHRDKTYQI